MQYGQQEKRLREMNSQTEQLEQKNQKLKMAENTQRIVTDGVILIAGVLMAAVCGHFPEMRPRPPHRNPAISALPDEA